MSNGAGGEYIPSIKSRQPGSGVSGNVSKTTSSTIHEGTLSRETGTAKYVGLDVSKCLQTKDTGIHKQP